MHDDMISDLNHPVWLLPGWQNSGVGHWQSHWEQLHGDFRLDQHDWASPLRGDWIMRLEEGLMAQSQPVLLAAHSLGCHLVAAWAAVTHQSHKVRAALLVAPPDTTRTQFPPELHSWRKPVCTRLPFASAVLASSDDPYASLDASQNLAQAWGSAWHNLGALGHINAVTGLKSFARARRELSKLEQLTH